LRAGAAAEAGVRATPTTMALLREATRRLEEEMGHALTEDEVIAVMCATVLDQAPRGAEAPAEGGEKPAPRVAPYQVALTVCEYCDRAWHDATGRSIDVPDSAVAMASCDAQYIGDVTGETPERSWQEIPPATARMVLRRDRGRCQVPGCRSSRWIHIHHVVHREHGGTNDPSNLVCLCFGHHQALHRHQIAISGNAPDALVFDLARFGDPA
jgi:5-methylcytosine-specific restriction endonuclease McrA